MAITLDGTSGITSAGTIADATAVVRPLVSGTSVASTSGTSIDFTGIPSWVKRITVMLKGVSTSGTSSLLLQIGAGSVQTSGYTSTSSSIWSGVAPITSTSGFIQYVAAASNTNSGHLVITLLGSNTWVNSGILKNATGGISAGAGDVALSGTLDRLRLTTVNGTDTFDAGSINILYE